MSKSKIREFNGAPNLECITCGELCEPFKYNKGGTIRYQKHDCIGGSKRTFSIKPNGDYKAN